jgi:hypothetical protein
MAEVAVFGVHFKHLYTSVNVVKNYKSNQSSLLVHYSAPLSLASAPSINAFICHQRQPRRAGEPAGSIGPEDLACAPSR